MFSHLHNFVSQDVYDATVKESMQNLEAKGVEQYNAYVKNVLENGSQSIHDTITKNNFPLMSTPLKRAVSSTGNKSKSLQLNNSLCAQVVVVLQHKQVALEKLFSFEFHAFAPAISNFGEILTCPNQMSLINEIVSPCHNSPDPLEEFHADYSVIIDGLRLVHQYPPAASQTFRQYCEMIYNKAISVYFSYYGRLDIIFDSFVDGSVKTSIERKREQQLRGSSLRRRVTATSECPKNWSVFLKDRNNQRELFVFMAECLSALRYQPNRQFFITCQQAVLTNGQIAMSESNIEGVEARIFLHVKHALSEGNSLITIVTNDTNVVVIALGIYHELRSQHHFQDIVIEYGMNDTHKKISVTELAYSLGLQRCQSLPFFHCLTGSNLTSGFRSITKKKAYQALKASKADVTLAKLYTHPFQDLSEDDPKFAVIQRLVILFYSRTADMTCIDDARHQFYFSRHQSLETLPPTKDALLLHTRRVIYECGKWRQCLHAQQQLPSPSAFGWQQSNDENIPWEPKWISGNEASKEARQFYKCACKSECTRCKCKTASLKCTVFCSCKCQDRTSYA